MEHPQRVDHRADIYSLGVVFYEMLTGELPLGKFAPPSRRVQVDVRLDEVVLKALEKEPERRYQQVSQVKADVETIAATGSAGMAAPARAAGPTPGEPEEQRDIHDGPSGQWQFELLPNLLSGERVLHFQKRVGPALWRSLPTCRFNVSWPPLSEMGLYVTDRRVIVITYVLRLVAHEFSMWFPATAPGTSSELLKRVSTGRSRWFGSYLELISEHPEKRWYRSRELRLLLCLRRPEWLEHTIAAASSQPAEKRPGNPLAGASRPHNRKAVVAGTVGMFTLILLAGMFLLKSGHRENADAAAGRWEFVSNPPIEPVALAAGPVNSQATELISLRQLYPAAYPGAPTDRVSLQIRSHGGLPSGGLPVRRE